MELLVLATLKWRMQAVTPFTFISYFLDKFNGGKPPSLALASRCTDIIIGTLKGSIGSFRAAHRLFNSLACIADGAMFGCAYGFTGSTFLSFRPSEIAAASALAAVSENQVVGSSSALSASEVPINKVNVFYHAQKTDQLNCCHLHNFSKCEACVFRFQVMIARCYELLQEQALVRKTGHVNGSPSVPQSPIGVLDATCFSFRSEDARLVSSQSNNISSSSSNDNQVSKRRRLSISPI
jgi:cyclin D1/2/4, plant